MSSKTKYTKLNMEALRNPRLLILPVDSDEAITEFAINDISGRDREKPRITIHYNNGTEKSIDIIASIENNAASIGHPLILFVIRRWEEIVRIRHHRASRRDDDIYNVVASHLKRVGTALLEGAKTRSVSKEVAFDHETSRPHHLRQVWEWLGKDIIKKIRNKSEKANLIEMALIKLLGNPFLLPVNISGKRLTILRAEVFYEVSEITDFLKSKQVTPFLTKRGKYTAMENAFDAWRFAVTQSTVRKYKSQARKKIPHRKEWFDPTFLEHNYVFVSDLNQSRSLDLPLIIVDVC